MELAFVLLFVLLGTGAILYAGLYTKSPRPKAPADAPVDKAAPRKDSATAEPEVSPIGRDDGMDHVDRTD